MLNILLAAAIVASMMSGSAGAASSRPPFSSYVDVAGHWARNTLEKAYNDGLIVGYENALFPDGNISGAQVLTILCRMFGAEKSADISGMGLTGKEWYYSDVAKAVQLGLLSASDKMDFDAPISRRDAFYLLAEAFQITDATPDATKLESFPDAGALTGAKRQAWASLVSRGIVQGIGGKLAADNKTTRAEFLAVAYRIAEKYMTDPNVRWDADVGTVLRGSVKVSGSTFSQGVWFDCAASYITLRNVRASGAVVRAQNLELLDIGGTTYIGRLVLASQSGEVVLTPKDTARVDKLVVGTGKGGVTVQSVGSIEVTGQKRYVAIRTSADTVTISGANCNVHVLRGAKVGKIEMLADASGSRVTADGEIGEITIVNKGAIIGGDGHVGTITKKRGGSEITAKYDKEIDESDHGIEGASIKIALPEKLSAGTALNASATLENVAQGLPCRFIWYVDGEAVSDTAITTGGQIPGLTHTFKYTRNTPGSAVVSAAVRYVNKFGDQQEITGKATIKLENFDAQRVLEKVTVGYKGDFTLQWALDNDLEDYEKELWVNAKGYSSNSQYLLWINLAYQRVNIFEGSERNWKLIRSCLVGTGAPGRGTATGVCTTTYKQKAGWTTYKYTCRPVVRFREGTGYAFHSRLYQPNSDTFQDSRIGFPISNGCIRMYDEDIWFIFDNVPDGTTVVIH